MSKKSPGTLAPEVLRALAAYQRAGDEEGKPDALASGMARRAGLGYVVLRDKSRAVLAVYRVRTYDGILRRMKRPPAGLLA